MVQIYVLTSSCSDDEVEVMCKDITKVTYILAFYNVTMGDFNAKVQKSDYESIIGQTDFGAGITGDRCSSTSSRRRGFS